MVYVFFLQNKYIWPDCQFFFFTKEQKSYQQMEQRPLQKLGKQNRLKTSEEKLIYQIVYKKKQLTSQCRICYFIFDGRLKIICNYMVTIFE